MSAAAPRWAALAFRLASQVSSLPARRGFPATASWAAYPLLHRGVVSCSVARPLPGALSQPRLRQASLAAALPRWHQALHSSAIGLQLQQVPGPDSGQVHPPPSPAGLPVPPRVPDAAREVEECDEVIQDLHETRRRVRALSSPPPGHVSLSSRLQSLSAALRQGATVVLHFCAAAPGRLWAFARLPWAEKRALLASGWAWVKTEAKHYWVGTKLLGTDLKIASRLGMKVLHGKTLSRRERTQLTRTVADAFRLVPMLVFVVVPFMEFLLPVALKLFPNMLPSTFEDKLRREEELKRAVTARLEIAKFLQDTVMEMAGDMTEARTGETRTSAAELYRFMQRVRAGAPVSSSELLRFAQLFNDELTLDNLERVQLVSLCRFVDIQPFGTDAFLRARLRAHLQRIKEDDLEIQEEGLDTLTEDELRVACRARGMRAPFGEGAVSFMREQLADWLDWSLHRSLPSSLLLLSRAFTVTQPMGPARSVDEAMLLDTLSALPDEAVEDVELFATREADADETSANERQLELLEREEEMIREEEEAESAVMAEALFPTLQDLPDHASTPAEKATMLAAAATAAAVVREAAAGMSMENLEGASAEERAAAAAEARQSKLRKVISALAALASSSGVAAERGAFMDLVEKEIERLEERLERRGGRMVFSRGVLQAPREQQARSGRHLGQQRLADHVASILSRVEKELDHADERIGTRLHIIDLDRDGVISLDELQNALSFLKEEVGEEELRAMLHLLSQQAEQGAAGSAHTIDVQRLMDLATAEDDKEGGQK